MTDQEFNAIRSAWAAAEIADDSAPFSERYRCSGRRVCDADMVLLLAEVERLNLDVENWRAHALKKHGEKLEKEL